MISCIYIYILLLYIYIIIIIYIYIYIYIHIFITYIYIYIYVYIWSIWDVLRRWTTIFGMCPEPKHRTTWRLAVTTWPDRGVERFKNGDGSKPYPPVVHIKIAVIYGCSSPVKKWYFHRYWSIAIWNITWSLTTSPETRTKHLQHFPHFPTSKIIKCQTHPRNDKFKILFMGDAYKSGEQK